MRTYTDTFPEQDQKRLEHDFERVLKSRKSGLEKAASIVEKLLAYWNADTPVYIGLFASLVNQYLYDPADPTRMRANVTGESLLLYIMQQAYPELVI